MVKKSIMKNKYLLLLILLTPLFINLKCRKDNTPEGYFFMCKLDGNSYRAEGGACVNCISAALLGDTLLAISGSRSIEIIVIGIIDGQKIKESTYILNNNIRNNNIKGKGTYDNNYPVDDKFDTDSLRTGQLTITRLDKVKKEIEGSFYFKAYNPVQNKIVNITEGKFRINYRD
jgi:hypothetical protein